MKRREKLANGPKASSAQLEIPFEPPGTASPRPVTVDELEKLVSERERTGGPMPELVEVTLDGEVLWPLPGDLPDPSPSPASAAYGSRDPLDGRGRR